MFIDAELTFCEHIRRVTNSSASSIGDSSVNRQVMKQLEHTFVISRLDYCNAILVGLPISMLGQLW